MGVSMPVDYVSSDAVKGMSDKRQIVIDENWSDAVRQRSLSKLLKFKQCVDVWKVWWMARFKDYADRKNPPKISPREQRPSLAVKFEKVKEAIDEELATNDELVKIDDDTTLESWAIENHSELANGLHEIVNGIKEIIEGGGDIGKFDGLLVEYQEFWRGVHSLYVMENQ